MSTEQDKFKHSKRMLKDDAHIAKQLKIAKIRIELIPLDYETNELPLLYFTNKFLKI